MSGVRCMGLINYFEENTMINRINAYFKVRKEEKFWRAFSIILLTSIFTAATSYLNLTRTIITLTNSSPGGLFYGLVVAASIITTFFGWFLSNLLYKGISLLFGANGSLKRMLTLSGYASIPMLIQSASRFVYFFVSGEKPVLLINEGLIGVISEHFTIFKILTLILTSYAISENYSISFKKSLLIAFSPLILITLIRSILSSFFGVRLDRNNILFN
ncbi:YIP1 family protein [Candidatus Bathyarchaeota archaeon]|nr:YIP1 family protein [Candidatus Bathyarchaeota archaeon]